MKVQSATRCQWITASGKQCKCWGTCSVNRLPLCDQHGAKAVREAVACGHNPADVVAETSERSA